MKKNIHLIIKKSVFLLIFLSTGIRVNGSEHWRSIETEHYELIYRSSFEKRANKIANTLEYVYPIVNKSIGAAPKKIPVYLDNTTLESNGSTSLSKVHLYTYSPSNYTFIGGNDWLTFLISHELRHVAQHSIEFRGATKLLYYILGGPIFLSNYNTILLHIPSWFYEGDAVVTETILSKYGRLSFPSYLMNTKSLILEGPKLNYHQAFYGSEYRQLPGHYQFGTMMVAHMRRKYGKDVIRKILLYTSTHKPLFHSAVKAITGKKLEQIYNDAREELKELWKKQLDNLTITDSEKLSKRKSSMFLNYFHPQSLMNGNILVLKFDKNNNYEFVEINPNTKTEKHFYTPYKLIHKNSKFSLSGDTLVWLEPRYEFSGYKKTKINSVTDIAIMKMTINKKSQQAISTITKGRFVNLALSENKKMIAVTETHKNYDHEVQILDSKTGKLIKKFQNPENRFYISLNWVDGDKKLIATISHNDKISLESIDIETEEHTTIIEPGYENIGTPYQHKEYVYYSSAYNGIDNIYAVNVDTKKKFQITSKKYGAFSPSISKCGQYILFSNYDKDGLELERMKLDPDKWIPIENVENRNIDYQKPLLDQEDEVITQEKIPTKKYKAKNHSILKNIFSLSGWMLTLLDNISIFFAKSNASNDGTFLGFLIAYDDIFGMLKQEYDFKFYLDCNKWTIRPSWSFSKIFPIVTIDALVSNKVEKIDKIENRYLGCKLDFPFAIPLNSLFITITPTFSTKVMREVTYFFHSKNTIYKQTDNRDKTEINYNFQLIAEFSKSKIGSYVVKPNRYTIGAIYRIQDSFEELNFKNGYNSECHRFINNDWGFSSKLYLPGFSQYDIIILKNVFQNVTSPNYFQDRNKESVYIPNSQYYPFINKLKYPLPPHHIGNIYGSRIAFCFPIYYPDFALGYFLFIQSITMTAYVEHVYLQGSHYKRNGKQIEHIWTFGVDLYVVCWPLSFDNHKDRNYDLKLKLFYKFSPEGFKLNKYNSKLAGSLCNKKANVPQNVFGIGIALEKHSKDIEVYA